MRSFWSLLLGLFGGSSAGLRWVDGTDIQHNETLLLESESES